MADTAHPSPCYRYAVSYAEHKSGVLQDLLRACRRHSEILNDIQMKRTLAVDFRYYLGTTTFQILIFLLTIHVFLDHLFFDTRHTLKIPLDILEPKDDECFILRDESSLKHNPEGQPKINNAFKDKPTTGQASKNQLLQTAPSVLIRLLRVSSSGEEDGTRVPRRLSRLPARGQITRDRSDGNYRRKSGVTSARLQHDTCAGAGSRRLDKSEETRLRRHRHNNRRIAIGCSAAAASW
ncbi:hypothetical protein J6590_059976 [Homalodisca vitripennis]|nr:hypothetical protein J6590_059976 [Homalodisca vitripennis]